MTDILILAIWDLVAMPVEGVQGEQYTATIEYGENDRVVDLKAVKTSSAM